MWLISESLTPAWCLALSHRLLEAKNKNIQHSGNFDLNIRVRKKNLLYFLKEKSLFLTLFKVYNSVVLT